MSKTIVPIFESNSKYFAPLIKIPFLAAAPIPPKYVSGTEITKAHGQETTKNVKALLIQVIKSFVIIEGIIAIAIAKKTTTGV